MARADREDVGSLLEKGDAAGPLVIKNGEDEDACLPTSSAGDIDQPLLRRKPSDWRAPFVILAFECLESTAFFGVATNLVMFLTTVLGESNSESATHAAGFAGTSYLTPLLGAFIADSLLGSYKTTLVSAVIYFLGIVTITLSALLPSLAPAAPDASVASGGVPLPSAASVQNLVFYAGLYLVALGSGGVKSALLPLGAEQFDDDNPADAERKGPFFSWFYICLTIGMLTSGTFIVWIQDQVSWVLGFGVCAASIALGLLGFLLATPLFKKTVPTGSPLKSVAQVLVAACRKAGVKVPADSSLLYEKSSSVDGGEANDQRDATTQPTTRLAHTSDFKFLDKAAVMDDTEEFLLLSAKKDAPSSWTLCTVTQVEELKALLRMVPTWLTCVVYSVAYSQMMTTVIEQGATMDPDVLGLFNVPAASLPAVEVLFVVGWTLFYDRALAPAAGRYTGNPRGLSLFQRMGAGRFLMILAMAAVAVIETVRLDGVRAGRRPASMLWQLPAYFLIGGSEALNYIGQLEFFFDQSPDSMKGMGTAFYLLSISAGNYLSSFLVSAVQSITAVDGAAGWIPDDLNKGHLDYFFWGLAGLCAINFVAHIACARTYTLKKAA